MLYKVYHILSICISLHRLGKAEHILIGNPTLAPSNLLKAGNLHTLTRLYYLHKARCVK